MIYNRDETDERIRGFIEWYNNMFCNALQNVLQCDMKHIRKKWIEEAIKWYFISRWSFVNSLPSQINLISLLYFLRMLCFFFFHYMLHICIEMHKMQWKRDWTRLKYILKVVWFEYILLYLRSSPFLHLHGNLIYSSCCNHSMWCIFANRFKYLYRLWRYCNAVFCAWILF